MNYEIQIYAKDRTKIIRFEDNPETGSNLDKLMAWEDFYYALGLVIDDKADKIEDGDRLIGRLSVQNVSFDEVIDTMCEDLSPQLTKILTEEREISVLV